MSTDHVSKTIDMVQGQIADLDVQLLEKKQMVNDLCKLAGRPPIYGDADLVSRRGATTTRPDEYYGKPLATVVRTILEKRQRANFGAATPNEIYDEMAAGGYAFGGKNEENNKRGLYASLSKNTVTFHKLPNGSYGLREWYPDLRESKEAKGKANGADAAPSNDKPLHDEVKEHSDAENVDVPAAPVKTAK